MLTQLPHPAPDVPVDAPDTALDGSRYGGYYGGQTEAFFPDQTRPAELVREILTSRRA